MTKFLKSDPDVLPTEALIFLQKALEINPLPDDPALWDILDDARNGEGDIYVVRSGKVIGAIYLEYFPKMLSVALLGGENINEWKEDLVAFLKSKLRERGISHLCVIGRHGWARMFKELKPLGTIFVGGV